MAKQDHSALLLFVIILVNLKALVLTNVAEYVPGKDALSDPWSSQTDTDTGMTSSPILDFSSSPGYRTTDDTYNEDYDDDDDDVVGLPLPPGGLPDSPTRKPNRYPITCAYYNFAKEDKPQLWKKTRRGDWKMRGKQKNKRWRRRLLDDHTQCSYSCVALWEVDSLKPSAAKIRKLSCSKWDCKPDCHQNMAVFDKTKLEFTCCCSSDYCNSPNVFLPSTSVSLEDMFKPIPKGPGNSIITTTPKVPTKGFICASDVKKQRQVSPGTNIPGRFHKVKRYHTPRDDAETEGQSGMRWPGGSDFRGERLSEDTVLCPNGSRCFTLWQPDATNKSQSNIEMQGCWLKTAICETNVCETKEAPRQNMRFCCCKGHKCNAQFKDSYVPSKQDIGIGTASTSAPAVPEAVGPIHNHSYRERTMIVILVLLPSLCLVFVLGYLAYRLCLTSKRATPPNSAAGTRTDADLAENGYEHGSAPTLNLDELKILDLIVRGRYSEVRRGTLNGKDVAVKIYQQHHRQYFFNERSAFTLPFMDNKNVVKFYGTAERTIESSGGDDSHTSDLSLGLGGGSFCVTQYLVVTELAPLGSLTGYLKHNTLDWYQLCHMCQGICGGLVHLHSDIKRGDLFKPAIAHRDINTRNILVKSDLSCVVADLGFAVGVMGSKIIRNGKPEVAEQCSLADVGTLRYMAPEVIDGAVNLRDCEASLKQIDVYALGLVIWELASRCVDLYQGAPMPDYQLPYQAEAGTHPLFEELQVLVVKYKTRPKFPEVWKDTHPAVRSLMETIQDCWDPDADARLTALCIHERIADMATLWIQSSSKRKRDVMPTLNTDLWPEVSRASNTTAIPGVVSNGVSVLPSYVDEEPRGQEGINSGLEGRTRDCGGRRVECDTVSAARYESRKSVPNTNFPIYDEGDDEGMAVTSLLIDSNLNKLTRRDADESSYETKRVREWLQEQSMSDSTMDTLLPLTPVSDRNQNLIDCDIEETLYSPPGPGTAVIPLPMVAVKANNVLLAERKGVISHPNQGRNPTVERNTHKRSDEELTVEGNQLIGTLDSRSSGGSETLGPLAKRKGSADNQSAPAVATQGDSGGVLDGVDGGGEFSSLVGHDLLNESHTQQQQQHQPARNAPIPFLQNQVHQGTVGQPKAQSVTMRPKLANVNIGANCNSYSHPVREANRNSRGGRGSIMSFPQCKQTKSALSGDKKADSSEVKSMKNKLAKLIRPKDLGHKFSAMIFGGKKKKSGMENHDELQERSDSGYQSQGFQDAGDSQTQMPCHYDNSGLEASPQSKSSTTEVVSPAGSTVPMQVGLCNGVAVSSTCQTIPNVTANHGASFSTGVMSNRLTNTDMKQGSFQDSHFKSPTLFAKSPRSHIEESPSSSTRNGYLPNSHTNTNSSSVPFQNKVKKNNGYVLLKDFPSQAVCPHPETPSEPTHDQNHNTETYLVARDNFEDVNHPASSGANVLEMNLLSEQNANINSQTDKNSLVSCHVKVPSSSFTNVLSNCTAHSQTQGTHRNSQDAKPDFTTTCSLPDSIDNESSGAIHKATSLSTQPSVEKATRDPGNSKTDSGNGSLNPSFLQRSGYSKLPEQVCQPQGTINTSLNQSPKVSERARKEKVRDHGPANLIMCHSWHEDSHTTEGSRYLRNGHRPKSLSLQGHNYKKINTVAEHDIPSPDSLVELDGVQLDIPSHKLSNGSNFNLPSCQPSKAKAESFRPIETSGDQLPSLDKSQRKKIGNATNGALPSSYSHDNFPVGDSRLNGWAESNLNKNNKKNGGVSDCIGGFGVTDSEKTILSQKEAKLNRVGCMSLDSSEKIRQRIKTPVSFKAGRLSLYDDRLMSQSLDSAMLYSQAGEEV